MSRRRTVWLAVGVGLLILGGAFLWVLPEIVRRVAVNQIGEATGRVVALDDVDLNLFTRRVAFKGFRLAEREPGEPFVSFERLEARLAPLALFRWDVRFSEITLTAPTVRLVRTGPTEFNFSDILERIPPATESEKPARFTVTVDRFTLLRGTIAAADRVTSPAGEWRLEGLSVGAGGLSTKSAEAPGHLAVQGRLGDTALAVDAESVQLSPGLLAARVSVEGFDLTEIRPYLAPDLPALPEAGTIGLTLVIALERAAGGLSQLVVSGDVRVQGLALTQAGRTDPFVTLARLGVGIKQADLLARTVTLSRIEAEGLGLRASRDPQGVIDVLAGARSGAADPAPAAPETPGRSAFAVRLERLALASGQVLFADEAVTPAQQWRVDGLTVDGEGLTTVAGGEPGRLRVRGRLVAGEGPGAEVGVEAEAVRLVPGAASARISLKGFEVGEVGAYLPAGLPVSPPSGRVDVSARVEVERGPAGLGRAQASGTAGITGLRLTQRGGSAPFATVGRLAVGLTGADLLARTVRVGSVELEGWQVRAARDRAGRIDLLGLMGSERPGGSAQAPAAPPPAAVSPPWRLDLERLTLGRGTVTFEDRAVSPATTLQLTDLSVRLDSVSWPAGPPARLALGTGLPGGGRFESKGTVQLSPFLADLSSSLRDAPLEPYQAYLPFAARLSGRVNGDSRSQIILDGGRPRVASQGSSWGQDLEVRAPGGTTPVFRIDRMELRGIDFSWPAYGFVDKVTVTGPAVRVERSQDGAMNLTTLFAPRDGAGPRDAARAGTARAPAASDRAAEQGAGQDYLRTLAIDIREVTVEDGHARFLDRTTRPAFSQELARLAVSLRDLSNEPERRVRVSAHGVVGGDAALDLQGELAPLGAALSGELLGELRDFALPSVNPYADSAVSWIVRTGTLDARVRYRVTEDRLAGENDVVVRNLQVAPSGATDEVKRRIGLPLGLIVALVKDSKGEIRLSVPVSGSLTDRRFDWSGAVWTAAKNVLVNVIAAPFKAIGRLATSDDKVEALIVEPVTFAPGSAALTPVTERHLTDIAGFLRRSPFVKLEVTAVGTARDVESLRAQEVAARIRSLQQKRELPDFASALRAEFAERLPGVTPPATPGDQLALLQSREPIPEGRLAELLARRLDVAREALTAAEGVQAERVVPGPPSALPTGPGEGRVEFRITQ